MTHSRLLIIDSEASSPVLSLSTGLLRRNLDITIESATSAAASLYYLTVHRYDIVICCDSMPDIDPQRWRAHITSLSSGSHLVLMSEAACHDREGFADRPGLPHLVKKPVNVADLLDSISSMLSKQTARSDELISR
jgi:DNA-binding NtrC family response regulator